MWSSCAPAPKYQSRRVGSAARQGRLLTGFPSRRLEGARGGAAILPIPNSFVSLSDAINRVGVDTYGADWRGNQANALHKITAQIRYRGPRSESERALIADEARAQRQRRDLFKILQRDFLGTPPSFEDAVPAVVMSDADGQLHDLPPQTWIKDDVAWMMLATGRVLRSATHPAGVILISEAIFSKELTNAHGCGPAPLTVERLLEMSEAEFAEFAKVALDTPEGAPAPTTVAAAEAHAAETPSDGGSHETDEDAPNDVIGDQWGDREEPAANEHVGSTPGQPNSQKRQSLIHVIKAKIAILYPNGVPPHATAPQVKRAVGIEASLST